MSVALPVHRPEPQRLERALASIARQTHGDLEILLILNGCSPVETILARDLASSDPRCRVLELPRPSLAGALNLALRAARHGLVARQDADDLSMPDRLEIQARALTARPDLAALGCAWREIDRASGRVRCTHRPPTDPREARWRLLLGNPFAHGSMMLRRDALRALGGYDQRLERAQDYDLWSRLARRHLIAAIPEPLYDWTHHGSAGHAGSEAQARAHARIMLRAWRELPLDAPETLPETLARVLMGAQRAEALDADLSADPTLPLLLARLWSEGVAPPMAARALEAARRANLREVGRDLRAQGARRVFLFPGGAHARWVLDHAHDLGLPIAGLCDDDPSAGLPAPETLGPGECLLICSDALEDTLWVRTAPLRERGVRVHRLYEDASRHERAAHPTPTLGRTA